MALSTRQRDLGPMFDALADGDAPLAASDTGTGTGTSGSTGGSTSSGGGTRVVGMAGAAGAGASGGSGSGAAHAMSEEGATSEEESAVQTVRQAMRTAYFKFNYPFCICFNICLNLSLGYGFRDGHEAIGLWTVPQDPEAHASDSKMWLDMMLTAFCVVFFTCMIVSSAIKGEVMKGKLAPVSRIALERTPFKFTPLRTDSLPVRAFSLALHFIVLWYIPTLCFWSLLCQAGALHGGDTDTLTKDANSSDVCNISYEFYIWFKALWSGTTASMAYPLVFVGALNIHNFPESVYDMYLTKQKEMQQRAPGAEMSSPGAAGAAGGYEPPDELESSPSISGAGSSIHSAHTTSTTR